MSILSAPISLVFEIFKICFIAVSMLFIFFKFFQESLKPCFWAMIAQFACNFEHAKGCATLSDAPGRSDTVQLYRDFCLC
jgi:hypothetical protein